GRGHIVCENRGLELDARREAPQRNVSFITQASREQRQSIGFRQTFEQAWFREPALTGDEAAAVLTQEEFVEPFNHGSVFDLRSEIGSDFLRQCPIVVPTTLVLVILNGVASHGFSRE